MIDYTFYLKNKTDNTIGNAITGINNNKPLNPTIITVKVKIIKNEINSLFIKRIFSFCFICKIIVSMLIPNNHPEVITPVPMRETLKPSRYQTIIKIIRIPKIHLGILNLLIIVVILFIFQYTLTPYTYTNIHVKSIIYNTNPFQSHIPFLKRVVV